MPDHPSQEPAPIPIRRFLRSILDLGADAADEDEISVRKIRLNLASVLFAAAACASLALPLLAGGTPTVLIAACLPLLMGVNLALLRWHKRSQAYGVLQLGAMQTFPFLTQALLGPHPAGLPFALWLALPPISAAICLGGPASTPWFAAFLAALAVQALAMPAVSQIDPIQLVAHLGLLSSILYVQSRFARGQRRKTVDRLADTHRQLKVAQERSERLLLSILPAPVAARLKDPNATLADGHPDVVVMFADIVDYTRIASGMTPIQVFALLNRVFCRFDELCDQYGLERIKTIGDGYMVAGGLHAHSEPPEVAMAALAMDMQNVLRDRDFTDGLPLELRIGIASGPVVAGVVGRGKFIYDLWGDTVNLAFRLCTEGPPSTIQCCHRSFERLRGAFVFAKPILLPLKGKGYVPVYRLQSPRILATPTSAHQPVAPSASKGSAPPQS